MPTVITHMVRRNVVGPPDGLNYIGAVLAQNPWAFWLFDETSTSDPAYDETPNARNGVYNLYPEAVGQLPAFHGQSPSTSHSVLVPLSSGDITVSGQTTPSAARWAVEAWVKINAMGSEDHVIFHQPNPSGGGFSFGIRAYGDVFVQGRKGGYSTTEQRGGEVDCTGIDWTAGWHHVVGVGTADQVIVFVDGLERGRANLFGTGPGYNWSGSDQPIHIGSWTDEVTELGQFNGWLDYLAVYFDGAFFANMGASVADHWNKSGY